MSYSKLLAVEFTNVAAVMLEGGTSVDELIQLVKETAEEIAERGDK